MNAPTRPEGVYQEWNGWSDFLGTTVRSCDRRNAQKTLEEWVAFAEQLSKENGGTLPSAGYMQKHKLYGLETAMRHNPELFSHLRKDRERRTIDEHVARANELSAENGGALPSSQWLKDNGEGSLSAMLTRYPKMFSHLKQNRDKKPLADQVVDAEKLAKEHGGKLPHQKWLLDNGYCGLAQQVKKNPTQFLHIEKSVPLKLDHTETLKNHVKDATELVEKFGYLPCSKWLRDNGYNNLRWATDAHPQYFSHFKREWRGGKSIEDHLSDAQKLSDAHGGTLPCVNWLIQNGKNGLYAMTQKHPDRFAHFKQQKKFKYLAEHICDAGELVVKHGGVPNSAWLVKNGFNGLDQIMRKKPQSFNHFRRVSLP